MKKFEIKKFVAAVDKKDYRKGFEKIRRAFYKYMDGVCDGTELVASFETREMAVRYFVDNLDDIKNSPRDMGSYVDVTGVWIEENECDEDGEYVDGGEIWYELIDAGQGTLEKNRTGRYEIDGGTELHCGDAVEIEIYDTWRQTAIEHDGNDYYAVGWKDVKLNGLKARLL